MERLTAKIADLESKIERLTLQFGQPLKQELKTDKSVSFTKCASCHDSAVAQGKGGGHVFFANGVLTASPEQKLSMLAAVYDNSMPKAGPKCSDEEVAKIVQELASRKTKTKN